MRSASCASLCAWTARRRPSAAMPACDSSLRVRRVSSHAMTSASRRTSTTRGERSPRLPIGVPITTSGMSASLLDLDLVPDPQAPACERARLGLDHERGAPHERRQPPRSQRRDAEHHAVRVAERHVDREPHADRVHLPALAEHERTGEVVATEQAAGALASRAGHLGRREHFAVTDQPHRYTLKRISSTSPSATTYSLPSTRSLCCSFAFAHEPVSSSSSQWITSARLL